MPRRCIPFRDPASGMTGWVTVDERTALCKTCRKAATLRCDYPVVRRNGSRTTCSRWICEGCATTVGDDMHYCPPHERASRLPGVP